MRAAVCPSTDPIPTPNRRIVKVLIQKLSVIDAIKSDQIGTFKSLLSKHVLNLKFGMLGKM